MLSSSQIPKYEQLDALAKTHGTSFYLFYPERFVKNLDELNAHLASYYPNSRLAYALKANYMPAICKLLRQHSYWAEVVSGMEYYIARLYLPGDQVIFNGPCKSFEDIKLALDENAIVNLDSFHEIEILKLLCGDFPEVSVGLRVSFDIGTGTSRFGFDFENGEFSRAVAELKRLGNVRLVSLHSHFTTRERSLDLFERRAKGAIRVYDSLPDKEEIRYFNLGGGFFGPMSDSAKSRLPAIPPTFEAYAKLIGECLFERFGDNGPCLILEPGVSMIADAMEYVVRVLDERTAQDGRFLTVDGSINSLYPTGSRYTPDFSVAGAGNAAVKRCNVTGYTCMEHDVLMGDIEIKAETGDFIVFHNRGAYSNVYKPPFIKEAPAIVGKDGTVYARRQAYADVIAPYLVD